MTITTKANGAAIKEAAYEEEVESLVAIPLRASWDFALEIQGAPKELDILARDISYDPVGIVVDAANFGAQQVHAVSGQEAGTLTFTLRDTRDRKLYKWFQKWAGEIVSSDGTFGLPANYVKRVRVYAETDAADSRQCDEYSMFVSAIGGFSPDRSSNEFFEFTVTLHELKSGVIVDAASSLANVGEWY